ncbi:MAG: cytochrome C [Gallionella sp.]
MKAIIIISTILVGWFAVGSVLAAKGDPLTPENLKMLATQEANKKWFIQMPDIAKKNNCTPCHDIYRRLVGPSWLDISKKYNGATKFTYNAQEYPLQEGLMMKVSKGGAGSWGAMPMPPNDAAGAKQADIKEMVSFVIGLEKANEEMKTSKKKYDAEQAAAKKK